MSRGGGGYTNLHISIQIAFLDEKKTEERKGERREKERGEKRREEEEEEEEIP